MDDERRRLVKLLAEFFMDEFRSDASGVGDWLVQGGQDPEEVVPAVERVLNGDI